MAWASLQSINALSLLITLTTLAPILSTAVPFSPRSKSELVSAVQKCLQLSSEGHCSKGPHGAIATWDVSKVTDTSRLFYKASSFNADISKWNVSHVTDMSYMFAGATSFNADISNWNVSNVATMASMFHGATSFNANISTWELPRLVEISCMFCEAKSFNGNFSKWDAILSKIKLLKLRDKSTDDDTASHTAPEIIISNTKSSTSSTQSIESNTQLLNINIYTCLALAVFAITIFVLTPTAVLLLLFKRRLRSKTSSSVEPQPPSPAISRTFSDPLLATVLAANPGVEITALLKPSSSPDTVPKKFKELKEGNSEEKRGDC